MLYLVDLVFGTVFTKHDPGIKIPESEPCHEAIRICEALVKCHLSCFVPRIFGTFHASCPRISGLKVCSNGPNLWLTIKVCSEFKVNGHQNCVASHYLYSLQKAFDISCWSCSSFVDYRLVSSCTLLKLTRILHINLNRVVYTRYVRYLYCI
jgi:hypothetical protein